MSILLAFVAQGSVFPISVRKALSLRAAPLAARFRFTAPVCMCVTSILLFYVPRLLVRDEVCDYEA